MPYNYIGSIEREDCVKRVYIFAIALVVFAYLPVSATIINIPDDYPTIQEGIDAAQNGDTVLVAPGVYVEIIAVENKNILLTSEQGPEITSIQGNITFGENVDTTCVFRGFTVIGQPDNTLPLIHCSYGSPTLIGNVITNCCPNQLGRGIYLEWSGARVEDNIIMNNITSYNGAGIGVSYSTPLIAGNLIINNRAGIDFNVARGGGIYIQNSEIILERNVVAHNRARYLFDIGGGICVGGSYLELTNCTIANNAVETVHYPREGYGGGITIGSSDVFIKNSIFWENYATSNPDINGPAVVTYSDIGQGYQGEGNISSDPLFVDAENNDYHLFPGSPCIDTGDPNSPLDPDSTRADMGAYFFDQTTDVYGPGEPSGPHEFQLHQNYPNPFNSQTIISYYLREEAVVSLHIFSITGFLVEALANRAVQTSGEHRYVWDGTDRNGKTVATGIYFYELYVDDYRESKAMIMIK